MTPETERITPRPPSPQAGAWEARKLLRAARVGTLATAAEGQPYAALVTPATAPDGTILLLLSTLSEHTRQLRAEPRAALLVAGSPAEANPQTTPRATFTGLAEPIDDAGLRARYLAVHPYAALYAGFGDFGLWGLRPLAAQFVGGFATAVRIRREHLLADAAAVAAVAAAEEGILAHCNADHADAMAAIARAAGGFGGTSEWRMVGVDVDGCDLAAGERVLRVAWSAPVADPAGVRAELVRLSRLAPMQPQVEPEQVLAFWFDSAPPSYRRVWFEQDDAFDAACRSRFGELLPLAKSGALDAWQETPRGALALVIVLDQFSRNLHRDTPEAFATDPAARSVARSALDRGFDRLLAPLERLFLYLPFEHSEKLADQELSERCSETLRGSFAEAEAVIAYARRHLEVIRRFGRFPHRNAALGRGSTAAETAWLTEHPSGF